MGLAMVGPYSGLWWALTAQLLVLSREPLGIDWLDLNGISVGIHGVCVGFLCVSRGLCGKSMGRRKTKRPLTE